MYRCDGSTWGDRGSQGRNFTQYRVGGFSNELASLERTLVGEARLNCLEPNFAVEMKATGLGHIDVTITITPDHMAQSHKFLIGLTKLF
jgi:hypothetical protein